MNDLKTEKSPVKGISRNVFILSVVSFLQDVSSEMLYPLIPLFLTSVLKASGAMVGVIEGIAEATARLTQVFSGYLSDKYKKRRAFTILGYSLSALGKPILALAAVWPVALFARVIDRFGKGFRTSPRDALIIESSPPEARGRAFGFHRSLDTAGAVAGPLIALLLVKLFAENLRPVFLLATIPAVIAVAALFFVNEKQQNRDIGGEKENTAERIKLSALSIKNLGAPFYFFLTASAIFSLGNSTDAFLLLRSKQLGLATLLVVLAYVLYNFVYTFSSFPAGVISDRIGRKKVLLLGFIVYGFVYLGFALADKTVYVWPLYAVYGFYIGITEGIGKALIGDIVKHELVGSALGLYQTVTGVAVLLASAIAGILWTYVGFSAPFYFGAVMAFLGSLTFFLFYIEKKDIKQNN
jgi:MFS family permease